MDKVLKVGPITLGELAEIIKQNPQMEHQHLTVHDVNTDEFLPVEYLMVNDETDVLDEGHHYFEISP